MVLTIFPTWDKEYTIRLEMWIEDFPKSTEYGNIMRLTTKDDDSRTDGGMVPSIYLHGNKLYVKNHPSGSSESVVQDWEGLQKQKWISLIFKQHQGSHVMITETMSSNSRLKCFNNIME